MLANKRSSAFPAGLVVYQIYPRSFKDSNNDGVGDLPGIMSKLEYLADLGINAIWLSPVYPSPMIDGGYDITDYENIDPLFGNLEDMDELIQQAHSRHIRVILDLVVNHSSDRHKWFIESRATCNNPKRDWYIWREGKLKGGPPNNWLSEFGGSAWEFDEITKQYYLHSFAKEQPDLNWSNPQVRTSVKDIMRFWLSRGVDGFRMDAVNWYAKDPHFRDDPPNLSYDPKIDGSSNTLRHLYSRGLPQVFNYLKELTEVLEEYRDRIMLVEAHFDMLFDVQCYFDFYHQIDSRVAAPFNFIDLYLPWRAQSFREYIDTFQRGIRLVDMPVYTTGNHDRPRLASRIGPDAARTAAVLFLTLPGTTVIYYGEEIGMEDIHPDPQHVQDIYGKRSSHGQGRDPERTPMQWSTNKYAGFSSSQPWLPVGTSYHKINVATELSDLDSQLNLYKRLLKFRAHSDTIKQGSYMPIVPNHADAFGFVREYQGDKVTVIANFSRTHSISCAVRGKLVLSTHGEPSPGDPLQPLEARVIAS